MMPGIIPLTNGRRMVAPVHNDTRAPLSNGDINALVSNCRIFMDAIIDERKRLELELHDFMPEIGVYEDENG
ncbi:MAG TPA: hypothetical protein ENJ13_04550 [Chromatiales bacterium]|nr:hypothetical protein [Chromatiales bacterium]